MRSWTFPLLLLPYLVLFGCANSEERVERGPKIAHVAFSQALLRDAVVDLGTLSGCSIELDDDVSSIPDLAVDFEARNKTLDQVLDDIIKIVKTEYRVDLKWSYVGPNRVRISRPIG